MLNLFRPLLLGAMLLFVAALAKAQNRYWISSSTSNWNNTANWSTSPGGAGGASVPTTGNVAVFDGSGGRNGACNLDIAPTVGGISMSGYTGTIDLNGFTLTSTGTHTFSTGIISNTGGTATLTLSTAGSTTFSGTTFNIDITGTSGRIFFNGSTFNGSLALTKTNNSTDNGLGGNQFNAATALINSSTHALQLAAQNPDIFQGELTLTINNTGDISLGRAAPGNQFNNNIVLNYNDLASIRFGQNGGTSTLANGMTVAVASVGASGCGGLQIANLTQIGTTPQAITLSGNNTATLTIGPGTTFNGPLTATSPSLGLQTSTFNGTTQLTKTGSVADNLRGGNLFTGTTIIVNQGADLVFGSNPSDAGDTFNGSSTFNNLGGNRIRISEETSGTVFNGNAVFTCSGTTDAANRIQISRLAGGQTTFNGSASFISNGTASDIHISYDAGTSTTFNGPVSFTSNAIGGGDFFVGVDGDVAFTGNIEFNSTCGDVIYLGQSNGHVSFGNGTLNIGAGGFAQGQLRLHQFTQTGSTPQALTFTGTASLRLGPSSEFNGAVTFVTPQIFLNGCTFNNTTYIEKNGASNNTGAGSNIFNGVTTLVNSGSGNFISGNTSNDIFNNDLTLTNSGAALISMADNSAGNIFNGNITVNSTAGNGIYFANNSGASATLASTKTIAVGSGGFSSGQLRLKQFKQTGASAQSLTLTGTSLLSIGPSSQFDGNVTFIAPQLLLNGTIFNGTGYFEKTGASDNISTGGNEYAGATTLVNSGSGTLDLANTSPDVFNSTLLINNTGSYRIQIGLNSAGNLFNGNVTINHGGTPNNVNTIIARNAGSTATFNGTLTLNCANTGITSGIVIANDGQASINGNVIVSSSNGRGVLFGAGTGAVILGNGYTIKENGTGSFNTGTLTLKGFTQTGPTAQNILLSGTANIILGPSSTFNGNVNFVAPQVYLHGAVYNGTAYIEKNNSTDNAGNGGNVFNNTTSIVNSGTGYLLSANVNPDTFNGQLTITNSGSSGIFLAHNVPGTLFNGNVIVNSSGSGGIYVANNTTGDATLASGLTLSVGAGGFGSGELRLRRFTQTGVTAQNLTFTGTGALRVGPSTTFNGAVDFTAPQVYLDGATFNSTAAILKNGAGINDGVGGNIFNGTTTLTTSSTSRWRLANTSGDIYNADVTLVRSAAGAFEVAYAQTNNFAGNITLNSVGGISFGTGAGIVQFTGSNAQFISKTTGSASPTIPRLTMAKSSNTLTLNTDLTIGTSAVFTSGIIHSTAGNYLNFAAGSAATGANNISYVEGPVRKTGNSAFTFPVGAGNFYRPVSISAPTTATHQFTAQYFLSAQGFGGTGTWDPSFYTLSGCEYWTLDRTTGTSNVTVGLSWNDVACGGSGYITNLADLRVARFNAATSKWVNEGNGGTSGTTSAGTITSAAAVTTFSPFTLASSSPVNPLPIELGSFWATDEGGLVALNWITYSEINNEKFTLERSPTGFDFEPIGTLPGAGNSGKKLTYKFVDEAPLGGLSYYRLKQTDYDGMESYSDVISVHRKGTGLTFQAYPNPAGNEWIRFNQKADIIIVNSMNQLIMTAYEVDKVDASNLAPGVYIIKNQKGEVVRFVRE